MQVQCKRCGLEYEIDPLKGFGRVSYFHCKRCSAKVVVDWEKQLEEEEEIFESLLKSTPIEQSSGDITSQAELDGENRDVKKKSKRGHSSYGKNRNNRSLGLTVKVILFMLFVGVIPGIVYFYVTSSEWERKTIEEGDRVGVLITELLVSEVDQWIDKNVRVLRTIGSMDDISSMKSADQVKYLKTLQKEYPWMYLVFTTDTKGMNVARSDGRELKDYSSRQYVKDVVRGASVSWQNLIGKTTKKPALVLAVPITEEQKVVGVLAAAMTRETISTLVVNFKRGQTGSVFLVDETGRTVAHQNNAFVRTQKDMSRHPLVEAGLNNVQGRVDFVDANGVETIGFSTKTQLGWILGFQQEKRESLGPLRDAQYFAYGLFGVTCVIILVIAYFASKAIVSPIKRLTDAANRISVGEMDVEITNNSSDEIGELADSIIRMQDSIRLSLLKLKESRDKKSSVATRN